MATYNGRTVTALGYVSGDPVQRMQIQYSDGSSEKVKASDVTGLTATEAAVVPALNANIKHGH